MKNTKKGVVKGVVLRILMGQVLVFSFVGLVYALVCFVAWQLFDWNWEAIRTFVVVGLIVSLPAVLAFIEDNRDYNQKI